MTYTLYSKTDQPLAGEAVLSQEMKDRADEVQGYIINDATSERVYPEVKKEQA